VPGNDCCLGWRQRPRLRTAGHCDRSTRSNQLRSVEAPAVLGPIARRAALRKNSCLSGAKINLRPIVRVTISAAKFHARLLYLKMLSFTILNFRPRFCRIHFVDLSMESAAADAELFGGGGHVAIRRCERLGNQFSFRLV